MIALAPVPAATRIAFAPERTEDLSLVERLVARAFGPGRLAKTAQRLREGSAPVLDASFVAWSGDEAVGCVRLWPVMIGGTPALFLGPIAVETAFRGQGIGGELVRLASDAARQAGWRVILLVGAQGFFGPLGFSAALARDVRLPGPVDQLRVLVRELAPGAAADLSGPVRALQTLEPDRPGA
jgi:predicted N-acetyltransferase YhbS